MCLSVCISTLCSLPPHAVPVQELQAQELAAQEEELERRLAVLRDQEEEKAKERLGTLLELDEADRRNYRAYWEAKLEYAMQHLGTDVRLCMLGGGLSFRFLLKT